MPTLAAEKSRTQPGMAWQVLLSRDIRPDEALRGSWQSAGRQEAGKNSAPYSTQAGWFSTMGYLLVPEAAGKDRSWSHRVTFREPGAGTTADSPRRGGAGRPIQTVKIKPPSQGDSEVVLTIGSDFAQVAASESTWKSVSEPALLAITQFWRFAAIDAELDVLTEQARSDLGHATLPSPRGLIQAKRLGEVARQVRALLVDLPHFQGPLTDPYRYCASDRSAQLYRNLAERLHLEEWSESIDERAEAVEDTYEAATEKLYEFRNFAWEAFLEVLIILILFGEIVLMAYEFFG